MNDRNVETGGLPAEIDLLMFDSAGVKMAVDTAQVDCIMGSEQAALRGISCSTLNEILGLRKEPAPTSSTVILYKNRGEAYGIRVDSLDEITAVPIKAIKPLPEPLSYFTGPRLFWGVVLRKNDIVLLIDLFRLAGLKSCKATEIA